MDRDPMIDSAATEACFRRTLGMIGGALIACGPSPQVPQPAGAETTTAMQPMPDPPDVGCGTGCVEDPPPEPIACGDAPVCDKGHWQGDFVVTDETSMDEIAGYASVSGVVRVEATGATCLRFLSCLQAAGGLSIEANPYLENVDGLENLASTTGFDVVVSTNPALTNLAGFSGLQTIDAGDLLLFKNDALTNMDAFASLTQIKGTLAISEHESLIEIAGFGALRQLGTYPNPMPPPAEFGGSFIVSGNPSLRRITGFVALDTIERHFTIQRNDVLTHLTGLHDIRAILGAFGVANNPELCKSEVFAVGADLEEGPAPGSSSILPYKDC